MLGSFGRFWQRPEAGLGLALLMALTFNNWLLGPYLNRELFDKNGAVSEFSALSQPHFWVFRGLDIISGCLMIGLAFFLSKQMAERSKNGNLLIGLTIVLGLANVLDASFTLPCSETLNAGCSIPVSLSPAHFQIPAHGYSSVIIAICYLALPVAGLVYALSRKMKLLMVFSALAAAIALESMLSTIVQYLNHHYFSVRASGTSQELEMAVLGAWFFCLSWSVYRQVFVSSLKLGYRISKEAA